jgi:hypothetical protein
MVSIASKDLFNMYMGGGDVIFSSRIGDTPARFTRPNSNPPRHKLEKRKKKKRRRRRNAARSAGYIK